MSFEFFFGLFGLVSGDSNTRHRSRLDGDWRLFAPLGAALFRDVNPANSAGDKLSSGLINPKFTNAQTDGPATISGSTSSLSGTLAQASVSVPFSADSKSSSSASSIASISSTSKLITNSTSPIQIPSLAKRYEFPLSGSSAKLLDPTGSGPFQPLKQGAHADLGAQIAPGGGRDLRVIYCRTVCLMLWFTVLRLIVGLVFERSLLTLEFYYLGQFRFHFLIPTLCLAIQVAAVSLIFIRNNDETNWLVPFYSSKDYLIRSRSNFRPKMEDYKRRIRISIALALVLALMSAVAIPTYLIHAVLRPSSELARRTPSPGEPVASTSLAPPSNRALAEPTGRQGASWSWSLSHLNLSPIERLLLLTWLALDCCWAIYATYICFIVSFYFNLICSIMRARFHGISKIIEDLAESNASKTTNQARKVTTLYLEHNETCELLDESNDFWQYLIFFTYFTYIPAYCYCLYNLFFVEFDAWPSFITWIIHNHTGFIILLISFSAAGVSTEAHAPYTSLHTLSLIQLPLDVEVNIATFLHRVRGLTIGYSCYDLFAITNASMSNTAAACASYFLIVADFSRSAVFTPAQLNGTSAPAGAPTS